MVTPGLRGFGALGPPGELVEHSPRGGRLPGAAKLPGRGDHISSAVHGVLERREGGGGPSPVTQWIQGVDMLSDTAGTPKKCLTLSRV